MTKISSTAFLQAWVDTVTARKDHMLSIWTQARTFTEYVKGHEDSITHEVATRLELQCYGSDYYSIDAVMYKEEDLVPDRPKGTYWFKDIRVAFEHENSFNYKLFQEVAHLLITRCDLRVVVTYPYGNPDSVLDYLHRVISSNRDALVFSQEESILLILGYDDGFVWEGLVYKSDGWKEL